MFEIASLIVVNLVIALIIGVIIGYLIGKRNFPKIKSIGNDKFDDLKDEKVKYALNPIFKKNSTLDFKPLILTSPKPSLKFVAKSYINCTTISPKLFKYPYL